MNNDVDYNTSIIDELFNTCSLDIVQLCWSYVNLPTQGPQVPHTLSFEQTYNSGVVTVQHIEGFIPVRLATPTDNVLGTLISEKLERHPIAKLNCSLDLPGIWHEQ
jgi:hypothetical protein